MARYRLYFMHARSGHIERFEEFDAADDTSAIERAQGQGGAAPLELWSGARKVYRLEPKPRLAPGAVADSNQGRSWRASA